VICQQFDAEAGESAFLVFDAFNVSRGPVAKLALASPVSTSGFTPSSLAKRRRCRGRSVAGGACGATTETLDLVI
jgi:hypothetical protein